MTGFENILVWVIAAGAIAAILLRPKGWPEAVWACAASLLLVAAGLISPEGALGAIGKGTDVYLFVAGMMLLAELARREGVFEWLAALAVRAARGSRVRLFTLIYLVGILVTVFLSNDATAVVLTPAVYAAVRKARAQGLAYLFICAFIANAASFVLPISNPANLVVYGRALPPLWPWLRAFFIPSLLAIAATYVALRCISGRELRGEIAGGIAVPALTGEGKRAAWGLIMAGAVLVTASALGFALGVPTCAAAVLAVLVTTRLRDHSLAGLLRGVSWSVLPLVAGLFVIVEALNRAGALGDITRALEWCSSLPREAGGLAAAFGVAALSNVMNNLPSGLLAGSAVRSMPLAAWIRDSLLIGVDLGPNLSVTGSLATILWLIALRREGEHVSAWQFFKAGALVMPPALLLATLAATLLSR